MQRLFKPVSNFTLATACMVVLCAAIGSGAAAQNSDLNSGQTLSPAIAASASAPAQQGDSAAPQLKADDVATQAASLPDLIAQQAPLATLTVEMNCLAGAIYFEARNETAEGQLAVGRVVVARSKSGRFPASYCGVVMQPSQFSFVRHHAIPSVEAGDPAWQQAVAIAQIAVAGSWQSPAEGALYFHARRVKPHWNRHRLARVDNHIFYQ